MQKKCHTIFELDHLADNEKEATSGLPNFNKLYNLGVLPHELSLRFSATYLPDRNFSIVEQMIETKSRIYKIYNLQFIPEFYTIYAKKHKNIWHKSMGTLRS